MARRLVLPLFFVLRVVTNAAQKSKHLMANVKDVGLGFSRIRPIALSTLVE